MDWFGKIVLAKLTSNRFCGILFTAVVQLLRYRKAGAAVWAIALVVAIMDYASAKMREKAV